MPRITAIIAINVALWIVPVAKAAQLLGPAQIDSIVRQNLGAEASAIGTPGSTLPPYLHAQLTGGKHPVLLIPVHIDRAKGSLSNLGVKAINLQGQQGSVDKNIGANCLGLAFFHGLGTPSRKTSPSSVHLIYECFSGYSLVAKESSSLEKLRPRAAGDAVMLDLENGGKLLVYWSSKDYVTKMLTPGD